MTVDAHESARGYPVPDEANKVAAEFPRLRLAIQSVATDVAGILTALATKSAIGHTHAIADVSGLSDALGAKMAASKTFALSDLTDTNIGSPIARQVLLFAAGKWVPGSVDWSDIANKPTGGITSEQVVNALGFTPPDGANVVTSFMARKGAVSLTAGDVATALGYTPSRSGGRNRHLNPAFQVCQDRATGSVTISGTGYALDGVIASLSGGGALSCSQTAKVTPGGSPNRLRAAVATADTSIAAGDYAAILLPIEGVDVADLQFGTALAKSFVWRCVINAPAGNYALAFCNGAQSRSYVVPFTVSVGEAGTDKQISVVVPGDTAGTWVSDASGIGMCARITLAAGATFQTAATGAWVAGNYFAGATQTNGMASTSNTFEVADIGLYVGTEAPTWELPALSDDLRRCQRYYWSATLHAPVGSTGSGTYFGASWLHPVRMRSGPAISFTDTAGNVSRFTVFTTSTQFNQTATGGTFVADDRRLILDASWSVTGVSAIWVEAVITCNARL